GANIFIILVGLGLPWLIAILYRQNALVIDRTGLWTSTVIMLVASVLLYVFLSTERLLSRKEGWTLLSVYGVYVAWIWLGG
ncbi:MAG: hypothetical protein R3264_10065, partial [Anaerolineae bacterium]|nr:hypothetical protein [Anaerolineae bacterium]